MSLIRINRQPTRGQLRVFALSWLVFVGAWGIAAGRHHHPEAARWLVAAALAVAALGLVFPPRVRPVYLALTYVTFPVGYVVSYLVLGALFFVVLTPLGMLMRLFGYDPLGASFSKTASSYWIPRDPAKKSVSYFDQS